MLSIRNLSLKAAKVKGGLVNAFKEVGDKVQKLPVPSLIPAQFASKSAERFLVGDDTDILTEAGKVSSDGIVKALDDQTVVEDLLQESIIDDRQISDILAVPLFVDSQPVLSRSDEGVENYSPPLNGNVVVIATATRDVSAGCDAQHSKADDVKTGSEPVLFENCSSSPERFGEDSVGDRRSTGLNNLELQVGLSSIEAPRVVSVLPEETTSAIVFSSKRNATKRTKKPTIAAKPNGKMR